MVKTKFTVIIIVVAVVIVLCCTQTRYVKNPKFDELLNRDSICAIKYPELEFVMKNYQLHKGKIIIMKSDSLVISPSPYWNLKNQNIAIDDIKRITVLDVEDARMPVIFTTFATGYIIGGVVHNISAKYKEDYDNWMLTTLGCGCLGGCLGTVISATSIPQQQHKYQFIDIDKADKRYQLLLLMGYRDKP